MDVFSKMDFSSSGGNNTEPMRLKKSKKKRGIYEKIGQYMSAGTGTRTYDEYRIYENSRSLRNICMESSSDDGLEATTRTGRQRTGRGQSLDYGQMDKKRLSWFNRESRSTEHTLARPLKEQKRKHHTLDRTEKYVVEHLRNKLQNPAFRNNGYSGSREWDPREKFEKGMYSTATGLEKTRFLSPGRSADDLLSMGEGRQKKNSGRLQIGKRFLRGEIGIKSFNYYLIKEGLKTTTTSPSTSTITTVRPRNSEKAGFKLQGMEMKGEQKKFADQQRLCNEISTDDTNQGRKGRKSSRADVSEENIYEEIFFRDRDAKKGETKASGKHTLHSDDEVIIGGSVGRAAGGARIHKKGESSWKFRDDCELCTQQEQCANVNCEICNSNCIKRRPSKSYNPKARPEFDFNTDEEDEGEEDTDTVYARIRRGRTGIFVNKYAEIESHYSRIVPKQDAVVDVDENEAEGVNKAPPLVHPQQPVLQFQSYNPNNPGVFKVETTPIAISGNYNPFEAKPVAENSYKVGKNVQNLYQEIRHVNVARGKSSSSSDSHSRNMSRRAGGSLRQDLVTEENYSEPRRQCRTDAVTYKACSEFSEDVDQGGGQHKMAREMSDSSIGDSLFSCSNQRRYFGSSESCRLGSDCRRCLEKCNYYSEDNKHYCCDCSSSYFSSDFDEIPVTFNRNVGSRASVQSNPTTSGVSYQQQHPNNDHYYDYPKKLKKGGSQFEPGYGEEFMRHVIHVNNTTSSPGEDDLKYRMPKSYQACSQRDAKSATTKPMPTGDVDIRNRDSADRKDIKRNVKKKYYYDDIMTIPNEVAYNLSYGMIRRDNKPQDAPERDTSLEQEDQQRQQVSSVPDDGFRIYEVIKERNPEPTTMSKPKQRADPNYAAVPARTKVDAKDTGAKPKITCLPGYNDEIPTMQIMKMSQPIYASPAKVKRIVVAAERRPKEENKVVSTMEVATTTASTESKWAEQCVKSNFDTSLRDADDPNAIEMEIEGQAARKNGQTQQTEWKAHKCQSNNNREDGKVDQIGKNAIGDKTRHTEPSIRDNPDIRVSAEMFI